MTKANEYTVKRVADDKFELWLADQRLAILTKEEAWPVITGKVHPQTMVPKADDEEKRTTP